MSDDILYGGIIIITQNMESFVEATSLSSENITKNNKYRRRARTRTAIFLILLQPFLYLPLLMEVYDSFMFFWGDGESPYDNHGNWALSSYFELPDEPMVDPEDITDFQQKCSELLSKKFSKNKLYHLRIYTHPNEGYSVVTSYSIQKERFFAQSLHGYASFGHEGNILYASSIVIRRWAKNNDFPAAGYYGRNIEYEITNELVDYYLSKIPEYTDNLKDFELSFYPECIVLYVNELQVDRFGVPQG